MAILVTGGAGYIGSHSVLSLQKAGYEVIVLDNLVYGHQDLVETVLKVKLIVGSTCDRSLLREIFTKYQIDAVMHFAAYAYVGESVTQPAKYYNNNVVGTLTLLEAMLEANINKFVFSSTCATYGVPDSVPITEDQSQNPINPYGATKLMVERILQDFNQAYDFRSVCLRYFNAAGADPEGNLGEDHNPETHLIPLVLHTALGKRESVSIFGTDYDTSDGSCIRDYIHVLDIAQAHILALKYLINNGATDVFNLGNGSGFSVKEVIETARKITGKEIKVELSDRRPGDPPALVGSGAKAQKILGWKPAYSNLDHIISHAWQWHQKRHP
jgi:UDP-glucose 4-epimerase